MGQPGKLSRQGFKAEIAKLLDQGKVFMTRHARIDHPERNISQADAERCLRKGTVQVDPYINRFGNWQAEIYRHLAGEELTVVAAIEWEKRIIVITAF